MTRDELRQVNTLLRRKLVEQKKFQQERETRLESEYRRKYFALFDNITEPVFIYDAITYKYLHCNQAAISFYGYTREEILALTPFELHTPEEFENVRENIDKQTEETPLTFTHLTKDRQYKKVEIKITDVYFEGAPAWMSLIHDITERTKMEEELNQYKFRLEEMINERTLEVLISNKKLKQEIGERKKAELAILESEKKFRSIIEKFLDGVVLVDEKGTIIEWNQAQEKICDASRAMVLGERIWDIQFNHLPEIERTEKTLQKIKDDWGDYLKTGKNPFPTNPSVAKLVHPDGRVSDIQRLYFTIERENGRMVAITTRDVTEQTALEKQLLQAQKMEAMGTLAGGIAHDFNNILAGIMGYTDLAIRKTDKNAPTQKYLDQVMTATRRATDLVKQILTFSRPDKKEKEPLRVSAILNEALKLVRSSLPTTISIVAKIDAENTFVFADPTQIHQVIMNLCTNASHAMKEKGGVLEVRLKEEIIEDGIYKELKPGPHLRLTVSDTGYGIKAELLDKIFEPFFTTKGPNEGTGMGLAVVHGIVKNHHGNISVYSVEGQGTSFSILLPVALNVIHKEKNRVEAIPGGNERILMVEDDARLAEVQKTLLEELGYRVTAMTSSVEALEIFKKLYDRFDLIVTDYMMPKMTGVQLTHNIHAIRPDIPVILCTGHHDIITPQKAKLNGIIEIILKPIELALFAQTIRHTLEKKVSM